MLILNFWYKKSDGCASYPENFSTKKGKIISCWYSMSTIWELNNIENEHRLQNGKDCMKKFCESLREQTRSIGSKYYWFWNAANIIEDAASIIDLENKKMLPSTKKELKLHQDAKICYIN